MKITAFKFTETKVSDKGNWIFVSVHTDQGITGIGEASQSGNDGLVLVALKHFEKQLLGLDPTNIVDLWQRMVYPRTVFSGDMGRIGATAISAIDQALWDIKGKALGVPVWKLMGGKYRDSVRLYANLNRGIFDRSPASFVGAAQRAVADGFTAIKCTPFDEVIYTHRDRAGYVADINLGVERLKQVRAAVGDSIDLLVDCHGRFDYPTAKQLLETLEPLNLFWIEEPIPEHQKEAMADLARSSKTTIAGSETLFGRREFWPIIRDRAVHVIMPDVKHAGGLTECLKIAALAEIQQIGVAPHSPAGPVSNMAGVHLAAAIPNFIILEYAFGEVSWRRESASPTESIERGYMPVPNRPGLGIELNQAIEAHRVLK